MASKKSHSTSNNKRKRKNRPNKGGDEQRWEKDQEDYYRRLLYSATKVLRKQAKLVRNLESQKVVRRIKERREKSSTETSNRTNDDKNGIEGTYQQLKHLELEYVVQESLRRLGILHLDPKMAKAAMKEEEEKEEEEEDGDENDVNEKLGDGQEEANHPKALNEESSPRTSQDDGGTKNSPTNKEKELVEKILRHKKMQSTLEEWNDKVTEYRRWTLHQQERMEPGFFQNNSSDTAASSSKKKKNKKRKVSGNSTANSTSNNNIPGDNNKSLFVCLGDENDQNGGSQEEGDEYATMPHYGPGSFPEEKKKNRMGQRQRKAKQLAIEAKKAGRLHRAADSVNWRKKKKPSHTTTTPENENRQHHQYPAAAAKHTGGANSDRASGKNEEQLHPSWAAAQKKKESSGIVQFQGKKITF